MSTKKVDVFQNFENVNMKRKQVVYLAENGFKPIEIAKWTGYSVSTIKTYAKKFLCLQEEACNTFYRITQKTKAALFSGRQIVYLYKFYDNNNKLICSKVGTTTRLPEQRLKEEIHYYRNHGIEIGKATICSIIDCGNIPAEGAESFARAEYIKQYPKAFCKNDRFFGVDISVRTFNKLINNYLGKEKPAL